MYLKQAMFVLLALAWSFPAMGEPLPDRPLRDRPGSVTSVPNEVIEELEEAWENDRNPSILVVIGIEHQGRLVYGLRSATIDRISSPLKSEFRWAIRDGIVIPSIQQLNDKKMIDRLQRNVGEVLSDQAGDLLKTQFDADIIIDVSLLKSHDRGRYAVSMRAIDTRKGTEIASEALLSIPEDLSVTRGAQFAAVMVQAFTKEYTRHGGDSIRPETYEFKLLGVEDRTGINQRTIREVTTEIEDIVNVKWAEANFTALDDQGFATIKVRYTRRLPDLINKIEEMVLPQYKLTWNIRQQQGNLVVAMLFADRVPDWYAITDPGSPDFSDRVRKRNAKIIASGMPKLGILVGEDIAEPLNAFDPSQEAPTSDFDLDLLQGELSNQFSGLGFNVVDATTLRHQLQKQLDNAKRYNNLTHLQRALGDLDSVDIVIHVNVDKSNGITRLAARLFDVGTARFIGFQSFPHPSVSRLTKYPVSPDKPDQVARFLTGALLNKFDQSLNQAVSTFDVQIRNVEDTKDVRALAELLKENIKAVEGVHDIQAAAPVGTFRLLYRGHADRDIVTPAIDAVSGRFHGAELQVIGNTLIINLKPIVLSDAEWQAKENADRNAMSGVIGDQDATKKPDGAAESIEGSRGSFSEKLLEARHSVYCVGYRYDGNFQMVGTAWVAADNRLATNAHVAEALLEEAIKLHNNDLDAYHESLNSGRLEFVAFAGPDYASSVTLDPSTFVIHRDYYRVIGEWLQWARSEGKEENYENEPIRSGDVALMTVRSGRAAKPLRIASRDTLVTQVQAAQRVAYVGFPAETLLRTTPDNPDSRVAQRIDIATIMAVTDFSERSGAPEMTRCVSTSLVTAGGASGSPYFNTQGEVIAINSAGSYSYISNVSVMRRIRTGVTYGQRADFLLELLNRKNSVALTAEHIAASLSKYQVVDAVYMNELQK